MPYENPQEGSQRSILDKGRPLENIKMLSAYSATTFATRACVARLRCT